MKNTRMKMIAGSILVSQFILPTGAFAEIDKEKVSTNETEKKGLSEAIEKKREELLGLDKDIMELESELKVLAKALKKEDELRQKELDIVEQEKVLGERWEGYTGRLAQWQIKGTPDQQFLEVLFGSTSFSDMISRAYTFKTLMNAEQEQIKALQEETQKLVKEKESLQREVDELKRKKEEALRKQNSLDKKRKAMEKELRSMQKAELERIQKELKEQQERKRQLLERQVTNEQFNELRSLTKTLKGDVTSHFISPAVGRLTSPYGIRSNPFGGSGTEFHTGIDIANVSGSPILATADGEVIQVVSSNVGYGNYVVLKHEIEGEVFHSLYAHLSMNGVKEGETVSQGEVIGLMGSTGRSTGSHLHFEIQDENRNHMNPALFLDKGEKKTTDKKKDKKE